MKTIAFFSNKGGVGKTTLAYHLAWSFADQDKRILLVDLDPQSNLTSLCIPEVRMEELWDDDDMKRQTLRGAVQPIVDGVGDIQAAHLESVSDSTRLALIPGDIRLSEFEQKLSDAWPRCMDRDPAAFRTASSFYRAIQAAARAHEADLVLMDVGPNLDAVNRSALIAANYVVTPLGADLFSIQGLKNLGPALERWGTEWNERLSKNPVPGLDLPTSAPEPLGYVVMPPSRYDGQVTGAYDKWLSQIPRVYAQSMLRERDPLPLTVTNDPRCLAVLKHFRSLMPMAQSVRKPIFKLTPADGAIGAHFYAVRVVGDQFRALSQAIATRVGLSMER